MIAMQTGKFQDGDLAALSQSQNADSLFKGSAVNAWGSRVSESGEGKRRVTVLNNQWACSLFTVEALS